MALGDSMNHWQTGRPVCQGQSYHDFVIGTTHAICNRCEKVVRVGGETHLLPPRIAGGSGNPGDWEVRFDSTTTKW